MNPRPRAVGDDHVDRPEVQARRRASRPVLMARRLPAGPQARRACRPRGGALPAPRLAPLLLSAARLRAVRRHAFPVAIAAGLHLFPSRTEKLSPPAPMVLPLVGRESRSPPLSAPPEPQGSGRAFFCPYPSFARFDWRCCLGCCFCAAVRPRAFLPVRHNFFTFARIR